MTMTISETDELFAKGVEAVEGGNFLVALACFEKAWQRDERPLHASYLALCIARERGQINRAEELCAMAMEKEPDNPAHYLNLGRVQLLGGRKTEAIGTWRRGLALGGDQRIIGELERLGVRKAPPFPSLSRGNPVNKYLGMILGRMGLR